jgi:hypothetical protein
MVLHGSTSMTLGDTFIRAFKGRTRQQPETLSRLSPLIGKADKGNDPHSNLPEKKRLRHFLL